MCNQVQMKWRYSFEKGSKKHQCPGCAHQTFNRVVDNVTKHYLPIEVGRCERINSCGYEGKIADYLKNNDIVYEKPVVIVEPTPMYISQHEVDNAMLRKGSKFHEFLGDKFSSSHRKMVKLRYRLGSIGDSVIYWQIDKDYKVRTGKIMDYNAVTGKRDKSVYPKWFHSSIRGFILKQCLFGEHLLSEMRGDVEIVESEKTAVIMSIFYPQKIWCATGGIQNLSLDRLKSFQGRKVTLHPDSGAYELWKQKTQDRIGVSRFMETHADKKGDDLADFYLSKMLSKYYSLL